MRQQSRQGHETFPEVEVEYWRRELVDYCPQGFQELNANHFLGALTPFGFGRPNQNELEGLALGFLPAVIIMLDSHRHTTHPLTKHSLRYGRQLTGCSNVSDSASGRSGVDRSFRDANPDVMGWLAYLS